MLSKRILVLMFLVAFLFVGCFPSVTPPVTENQAPTITSTAITTATVGVTYFYNVDATDPDGDTLTYSLDLKPSGMTINSANGLIKWTPTAKGDYPVVVEVSDKSLSITQSFTIKVSKPPLVNQAPVIYSSPITTATVGVTYVYDVNATDPNGDTLTYSLITYYHSGMYINPASGLIIWIPTAKGNYAVTVMVSDGVLIDIQGFTIVVSKPEPEPEPEPEIVLTGIKVDPKTMTLFVGESETIKSVTATYEIKGFEVPIPLGDCTYVSEDDLIAKVSNDGVITAGLEGTVIITVEYKDKTDEITVTVSEPVVKTITIRWLEDAVSFYPDGSDWDSWPNDPIPGYYDDAKKESFPASEPATLIQDNGGYHFADVNEYYNYLITPEAELEGSIVISGTGELSGYATYIYNELPTEDILVGQVEIIIGENITGLTTDGIPIDEDHDGIMVGTYTQWTYKFGTEEEVKAEEKYPDAIRCEGFDDKWLVRFADYTAHGGE